MNNTERHLIAMVVIFAVPYLVWRLGRTDYWAPLVVVQIVAGIVLGPGVLGAVFPDYYAFVFNPQVIGALNGMAWWAVMLFVWIAGIELDLKQAWKHRTESSLTARAAWARCCCPAAVGWERPAIAGSSCSASACPVPSRRCRS